MSRADHAEGPFVPGATCADAPALSLESGEARTFIRDAQARAGGSGDAWPGNPGLMDEPAVARRIDAFADPDGDSLEIVDPEQYVIQREFARGGLGRILEAYDRRLERPVAVKELLTSGAHAAARFVREARLTARLQHPSIVPVHEVGRWPSGKVYYAMTLVRGRTLRDEITDHATLRDRLGLLPNVIAVAEAVAYAHSEGIIHRDIKPSNVLVGPFGETVVIDWGLAKDLRAPPRADPEADAIALDGPALGQTAVGAVLGTPEYMSPEQAEGKVVDERADVYALGALLYHVFSGRPPFTRERIDQVIARVLEGPPVPLTSREPNVPKELAAIVAKAMARQPNDRYPTARELAADLRRFQTGQMIAAHEYTALSLFVRWLKRHRTVVSVVAIALLVVATVGALSVDRVIEERNHAERARAIAEARSEELTLVQARTSLEHDPTASLAWLKTYPLSGPDEPALRTIAADAWARGVARFVLKLDDKAEEGVFSPDGASFAVSNPNAVTLFDLSTGRRVWRVDRRATNLIDFSKDGALVISVGNDGRIVLLSAATGGARELVGHLGAIRGYHAAPDGKRFITAGVDGTVRLWTLETGEHRIVAHHRGGASDVDYAQDGRRIVSVGVDDRVLIHTLDDGRSVALTGCSTRGLDRVRFSSDGRRLAVASSSGRVLLHDLAGNGSCRELFRHEGGVLELAFSPDGHWLASAGADGVVGLSPVEGGEPNVLRGHSDQVLTLAFSPDGETLASAGLDSSVRLWSPKTGESRVLRGHSGIINALVYSGDGHMLASMGHDRAARVWDLSAPSPRALVGHTSDVNALDYSASGLELATVSQDRTARVWTLATGASRVFSGHADGVYRGVFSGDGNRLLTTSWDHDLRVFNLRTGDSVVLRGHENIPWRGVFTPDGRSVVSASRDGTIRRWALETGTSEILGRHAGAVRGISLAPDGRSLATGGEDARIGIWSLDGHAHRLWAGPHGSVERLVHSPDGRILASGDVDGAVRLWRLDAEPDDGRRVMTLGEPIKALSFSPDGAFLAVGADEQLRVLTLARGTEIVLRGHEGAIRHLSFVPRGDLLVSLAADRTARVWDLAHGGRLRMLLRTPSYLLHGVVSPDGKTYATGGWDRIVRLWPLEALVLPASREEMGAWLSSTTTAVIGPENELGTPP